MSARADATPTTPAAEVEPEKLLGSRLFGVFWLSRLLSQTAQGALLYGLFILIVDRTDKSIYGSLFVLCSTVPSLCFGLIGGWVADRVPTRPYMVALNVVRAVLVLLLLRSRPTCRPSSSSRSASGRRTSSSRRLSLPPSRGWWRTNNWRPARRWPTWR